MTHKLRIANLVITLALAILLAACAKAAPDGNQTPSSAATPSASAGTATSNTAATSDTAGATAAASDTTGGDATAAPAAGALPLYLDSAAPVEARVEDLLGRMTLAEKIGQMTQVEKNSIAAADVAVYGIGSVLSGGSGYPRPNTAAGWAEMVREYQDAALATRLGIPIIYATDAVHGMAQTGGATIFPHNIGLGAAADADLVYRVNRATAVEASAVGVRWNFAPVLSVTQDVRWGRTYESFGSDTALVSELGAAAVRGLQDMGESGDGLSGPTAILATPKHFIGDGGTVWGSSTQNIMDTDYLLDQGDVQMDEAAWRELFLPPYAAAVAEGAGVVMASFNSIDGVKVHGRADLLSGVLRDELGFAGFVVSDWGGCDQITDDYDEAIVRCINAGVDMNMVPYDYVRFVDVLTRAVERGDVSEARIDEAVRRILAAKFELGLFEQPHPDPALLAQVGADEHRELAREAVRRSLVLLQNENEALPIGRSSTALIFVAGEAADDPGAQSGGWTVEWQGVNGDIGGATSILDGIEAAAADGARVQFNRFGNYERIPEDADVGIVVLAESPYAEGVGDRADLRLDETQIALIERVAERSAKVVVVLLSGRPLVITEQLPLADAWVAAWLPGSEGQGVADVLFGDYPFTGRLSFDWPRSNEDIPNGDPLFPRGFGLTTE